MIGNDPGYQAWMQAIRQTSDRYKYLTDNARDALSYIAAPQSPATYGYGPMANALLSRANNTSTALLSPTNPFNPQLMAYMMNAPGGNTIGLPDDSNAPVSNPQLLMALLGRSGVG